MPLFSSKRDVSVKRRHIPDGLWLKCEKCRELVYSKEVTANCKVCPKCRHHLMLTASERIALLADEGTFKEINKEITSSDPLSFVDTKPYSSRIKENRNKTGINEAVITGLCAIGGYNSALAVMDFTFLGGSMGSAVGEKITRIIEEAARVECPLIIVTASGGARMQESILSLMQMAKTSGALNLLSRKRLPFISILTNPTTGGTTASFASLGDIIIAEPGALIGFAGPRVIKQTINKELPQGFQTSEFLLEHGMIDMVVDRRDLKKTVVQILSGLMAGRKPASVNGTSSSENMVSSKASPVKIRQ